MENISVSIIVPVYKAEKTIDRCIQSVLQQTFSNWELILVVDGSPDNSYEICNRYAEQDNRIKAYKKGNEGVSATRNYGLDRIAGEYFCFIDSDDSIETDALEKMYKAAKDAMVDLVICGFNEVVRDRIIKRSYEKTLIIGKENIAGFVGKHYLEWLVSSPWGKLYKNIELPTRRFDNTISLGEDLKFNIELFGEIGSLLVIEDCLYRYISSDNSLTKTYKPGNYPAICNIYEISRSYMKSVFGSDYYRNMQLINFKLFTFCAAFIYQNMELDDTESEKRLIKEICNNVWLQDALNNLPTNMRLDQRMLKVLLRNKKYTTLYFYATLKHTVKKILLCCGRM